MHGNKFINALISEQGYTQNQIAEKSGVKQQTISNAVHQKPHPI